MAAVVDCEVPTPPPAKAKMTVLISWESHEKLWIHCRKLKKTYDEMIDELIKENLNRFVLQDRGGRQREDEAAA